MWTRGSVWLLFVAYGLAAGPVPDAKVELGRYLFYDKRMSGNGTQSCASCHRQELAFTDGRAVAVGSTGAAHARNSMSLVKVGSRSALTWANPGLHSLEKQALTPMFSLAPVELGVDRVRFLAVIQADGIYRRLFPVAFFGEKNVYTIANVARAIAAFERGIVSKSSAYERYRYGGDAGAISDSAKRGEVVFHSEPYSCYRCHNDADFGGREYRNTGLYNLPGTVSYPAGNAGVYERSQLPADIGRFKIPILRNIALTAPYMHDGSVATLEEVLDHYAAGGRTIADGGNAGVGHDNPSKDARVRKLQLTRQNREDLLAFLRSLTDEDLIHDLRFSDPWR